MATLALPNGIIIDKTTGQAIAPSLSAEKAEKATKRESHAKELGRDRSNKPVRCTVNELPAAPAALTTVGVVWMYWALGLSDYDIRDCTGLTLLQVENIKGISTFQELQNRITSNLTKLGEEDVHSRLAGMVGRALDVQEGILDDNDVDATVKAKVTDSILDRAGYAPKQIIENRHRVEGGLIIKYIEETNLDAKRVPKINIDRTGAIDA